MPHSILDSANGQATSVFRFVVLIFGLLVGNVHSRSEETISNPIVTVRYAAEAGPIDNPLKGWCQYPNVAKPWQPAAMVFHYVSWRDLEPVEGQYEFERWETEQWNQPHLANKHVVLRIFADYPTRGAGIPQWLIDKGVPMRSYEDYGGGVSPDYDHPAMQKGLARLIAAFGKRYNHDPRVAFVQLGLLGHWGEWHTYPRNELFASPSTQQSVIDRFRSAFPDKHLMIRTPDGYAGTLPWIGFHDDLFPADTDNGKDWSFLAKIRDRGREKNWLRAPIGGEMVPGEAKRWVVDDYETTATMIDRSHFSWVGPYCPLNMEDPSAAMKQNSASLVRRMGYEFRLIASRHASPVSNDQSMVLQLLLINQGVAPFYYPWKVQIALLDRSRRVVKTFDADWDIRQWIPGRRNKLAAKIDLLDVSVGTYDLALAIIDPWTKKPSIRFANETPTHEGWTLLSKVVIQSQTTAR